MLEKKKGTAKAVKVTIMEENKKLLVKDYSRSSQDEVYYTSEKYRDFIYHTYLTPAGWHFNMQYKNVYLTNQVDLMVNGNYFADKQEYVIKNFVEAAENFLAKDNFYEKIKEKYDDYFIRHNPVEKFSIYSKGAMLFNIILEDDLHSSDQSNVEDAYDELDR